MAIEVDLFRWLTGSGIPRLQDGESLEADLSASRKDGLGLVRTGRLVVTSSQLLFRPYLPIFLQVPPVSAIESKGAF